MISEIWTFLSSTATKVLDFIEACLDFIEKCLDSLNPFPSNSSAWEVEPVEQNVQPKNHWSVGICEEYIGIDKGEFKGDCENAISKIQAFCNANKVTASSNGHGYGSITINDVKHSYNPYGIDINMMLAWCNIEMPDDTNKSAKLIDQQSLIKAPMVVSYETKTRKPKKPVPETPRTRVKLDRACKTKTKSL